MFTDHILKTKRETITDIEGFHKARDPFKAWGKPIVSLMWLLWGGALVVFFMKISDTSSWALQYDQQVQESVGYWAIGLGLGFLWNSFLTALFAAEKKALGILSEEWSAKLNEELVEIAMASEKTGIDETKKAELLTRKNKLDRHLGRLEE